ncbi:PAAR domain-containing protein [Kaistella jeonii]|uniref:PaaR repeat-containing protein n=1 Tax=Kaistella jeonii TaxID=266749 RepID=A0A0C1F4N9_9FLAO|nr:PAAR domain-containing protein [Kaistella jeonii]KIA88077.1 PaaR repeat-containing protein [Kaistella jeonii]SFC31779.1 Zn-binding Pro-Ala-Ala-Arg (PAAR) domain-containing protein, incolved in TypeVI secretion [Kaistella jeonii]VEI95621.1 Uncharacterized conserved protein [Kaistella jeonii]
MPNAARLNDPTDHGGVIVGPCCPTVLIGGMPAANLGDMHICPPPESPPHLSTPFPLGSSTVLIGGKPALHVGDSAGYGAKIILGCPTVIIGS